MKSEFLRCYFFHGRHAVRFRDSDKNRIFALQPCTTYDQRPPTHEKSTLFFPLPDAGARRIPAASRGARRGLRKLQGHGRHSAVHLPRVHHDQRGPRVRDRQEPLALLHGRLLHRHGHGGPALAAHRSLLYLRAAPLRAVDGPGGLEGEPPLEPVCGPDLRGHPLHDARGAEAQGELDLPQDPGAGHLR